MFVSPVLCTWLENFVRSFESAEPAERSAEKPSANVLFFRCAGVLRVLRVLSFLVFSFRGPSARYSASCCKIVVFILCVPCYLFWLNMELETCNFVKHDDWDWSDPRTLGVASPPLSGSRPLLASAGLLVGGQLAVVKSRLRSLDVVCHCGGTGDRGSLFAPQSSCLGSSRRQGSYLPSGKVLAEHAVSRERWGADTHDHKLTTY